MTPATIWLKVDARSERPSLPTPTEWSKTPPAPGARRVGGGTFPFVYEEDEQGRFHGPMTIFWRGQPYDPHARGTPWTEAHWKNGVLHGAFRRWSGYSVIAGEFADGRPHGSWADWLDGTLCTVKRWEHGRLVTVTLHNWVLAGLPEVPPRPPQIQLNGKLAGSLDEALAAGAAAEELKIEFWTEPKLPDALWGLSNLRSLEIRRTTLKALPAAIGQLTKLETLSIAESPLKALPEALAQLTALKHFELLQTWVMELPNLSTLQKLEKLNVCDNPLVHVPPWVGELTSLKWLAVGGTRIEHLPPELGKLQQLTSVSAQHQRHYSLGPRGTLVSLCPELAACKALTGIVADTQNVLQVPEALTGCAGLKSLNVLGNPLLRLPARVGGWPQLNALHALGCYLTTLPSDLNELTHLSTLDLRNNELRQRVSLNVERLKLDNNPFEGPAPAEAPAKKRGRPLATPKRTPASVSTPAGPSPFAVALTETSALTALKKKHRAHAGRWLVGDALDNAKKYVQAAGKAGDPAVALLPALAKTLAGLTSEGLGCESGAFPVVAVLGPQRSLDADVADLLRDQDLLTPIALEEVARRWSGSPHDATAGLPEHLTNLGPVEGWRLKTWSKGKNPGGKDSNEGFEQVEGLTVQLPAPAGVWSALMPSAEPESQFRSKLTVPGVGLSAEEQRELERVTSMAGSLRAQLIVFEATQGRMAVECDRSRDGALARALISAKLLHADDHATPFDDERWKPVDAFLRTNLTELRHYCVGAWALYYRFWLGRASNGRLVGLHTRVVWT